MWAITPFTTPAVWSLRDELKSRMGLTNEQDDAKANDAELIRFILTSSTSFHWLSCNWNIPRLAR